ncbi:hypothetical protein B566_EDAN017132 [Ephemera danica]|nr:hypothetical protein B566_EDAN017132 [Ephemera danica]
MIDIYCRYVRNSKTSKVTPYRGPEVWPQLFPQAAGERQSPVDIKTDEANSDTTLETRKLTISYEEQSDLQLLNTGQGWKVQAPQPDSSLEGGPLGDDIYKLEQFHCHWGPTCDEGSEHTVDGKAFAGELHLVHWNSSKYDSFAEAAQHPDGLAVLGVFLQVSDNHSDSEDEGDEHQRGFHPEMQKIADQLTEVRYNGQKTQLTASINPARLLPESLGYWTYLGSLTTPPCSECVTWLVFKEHINVTEKQPAEERLVLKNYRPPQPLGNRSLRECNAA